MIYCLRCETGNADDAVACAMCGNTLTKSDNALERLQQAVDREKVTMSPLRRETKKPQRNEQAKAEREIAWIRGWASMTRAFGALAIIGGFSLGALEMTREEFPMIGIGVVLGGGAALGQGYLIGAVGGAWRALERIASAMEKKL